MNNLRRHNIFALPLDDFSSRHDVRLLYAPLAGVCSLASTDAKSRCLDKDVDTYPDCPSAHALEPFMQGSPRAGQRPTPSPLPTTSSNSTSFRLQVQLRLLLLFRQWAAPPKKSPNNSWQ